MQKWLDKAINADEDMHDGKAINDDEDMHDDKAINDDEDTDDEYIAYYKHVRDNLDKAIKIIKWNSDESNCRLDIKDITTCTEIPGAVFILADKNYGMTLLPIDTMVSAEENMLEELKARKVNSNCEEIVKIMESKIRKFEKSNCLQARQHLDSLEINRFDRPLKIKMPFLKLNAKIHKLSSKDITEKNLSKLKFRPVQDSSSWIIKPYAEILMTLLRDLMTAVTNKYSSMKRISSENGIKISREMRQLEFSENQSKFFMSSDMSSAYSNIFKYDVFRAIILSTTILEANDWRRDLILKLTELILANNFIESSAGVYQLGDCLPMGSSASQDCLNIVGMVNELEFFENISAKKEFDVKINDDFEVLIRVKSQINEINSLTKQEKQYLKLFKRYIDDTHSVCSGKEISTMKSLIIKILKIYPKHLVMNASLSLMHFSHLDSCGYTGFQKGKMTTFVRRNYTAPVNVVPSQSNCPASNKYSIILSELLRYRRMCSTSQFVRLNETHLFTEMIKAGYKKTDLKKQFAKSQDFI